MMWMRIREMMIDARSAMLSESTVVQSKAKQRNATVQNKAGV